MLGMSLILIMVFLPICTSYPERMLSYCSARPIEAYASIMDTTFQPDDSLQITLKRGNTVLTSADKYIDGETLTVSVSVPSGYLYVLETSNAQFTGGSCSNTRVISNPATIVMPSDSSNVAIWAGFATGRNNVKVTSKLIIGATIAYPTPVPSIPPVTVSKQDKAMCALANAMGASLVLSTGWQCVNGAPTTPVCGGNGSNRWSGVKCNKKKKITIIKLSKAKLSGSIPTDIGDLTNLKSLKLNNNKLAGSLPTSFGKLKNLRLIDISSNSLTQSIPASLSNLKRITYLGLDSNSLTGTIPQLPKGKKIKKIDLQENSLTGEIPSSFGELKKLKALQLQGNSLTGTVPSSLCSATKIVKIFTYSNPGLTCYASCLPDSKAKFEYGVSSCPNR